jgi:hypothetical protein
MQTKSVQDGPSSALAAPVTRYLTINSQYPNREKRRRRAPKRSNPRTRGAFGLLPSVPAVSPTFVSREERLWLAAAPASVLRRRAR